MDYGLASHPAVSPDEDFSEPLHAYVPATWVTVCGLDLGSDIIMRHVSWEDRPRELADCPQCAAVANASD
jgi:hypothetical protein